MIVHVHVHSVCAAVRLWTQCFLTRVTGSFFRFGTLPMACDETGRQRAQRAREAVERRGALTLDVVDARESSVCVALTPAHVMLV